LRPIRNEQMILKGGKQASQAGTPGVQTEKQGEIFAI
jgi:hypothetical protein